MLLQLPAAKNIVMMTVILEVSSQVFRQISSKYVCIKLVALPSLAHTIFYCKPHKHMALNLIKIIPYKVINIVVYGLNWKIKDTNYPLTDAVSPDIQ